MIRLLTLVGFYFIIIIVLIKIKRQLLTQKELVTTCNLSILKSLRSSQIFYIDVKNSYTFRHDEFYDLTISLPPRLPIVSTMKFEGNPMTIYECKHVKVQKFRTTSTISWKRPNTMIISLLGIDSDTTLKLYILKHIFKSFQWHCKADLTQDTSVFTKAVQPSTCSVMKQLKIGQCCKTKG